MKLFRIRGGVHPDDNKALTAEQAIEDLPLPPRLHIPLQQHIGLPAEPVVQPGDQVLKGQLLAHSQGAVSAPVHAPSSGLIRKIGDYPAHHPSGLAVRTIVLETDGREQWVEQSEETADPLQMSPAEIATRVAAAGIVGMGGATFPSAVKLNLHTRYALHTLVINGAECEPFLTCDDRLMREHSGQIIDGVRIMARALGTARIIIAIENNKPQAQQAMQAAAAVDPAIVVAYLPTRYPMGSEKHLVQTLTGRETPARGLTADIGVVVHNAATALAVHEALRHGRPLLSRVVTVSGDAVRSPKNLRVPLGTPVQALIDHCGGFVREAQQLISGGPMMGQPLPGLRVPIVKGSNGILALGDAPQADDMPCIRCGSCVQACPCGLLPLEMAGHARSGDLDGALDYGLGDCISCGSCAYVCPSNIPLVQYFKHAKGAVAERSRNAAKQEEIRLLSEQRQIRLEKQKQAKRAAMAARKKAAAEAKKA